MSPRASERETAVAPSASMMSLKLAIEGVCKPSHSSLARSWCASRTPAIDTATMTGTIAARMSKAMARQTHQWPARTSNVHRELCWLI
jgi:hypothetical protein